MTTTKTDAQAWAEFPDRMLLASADEIEARLADLVRHPETRAELADIAARLRAEVARRNACTSDEDACENPGHDH